ncbi:MAG TPA: CRISPR system precrRNA processing endoribonuclease RAMP protein Cas6 [Thermoanaerobaculia bacterium]
MLTLERMGRGGLGAGRPRFELARVEAQDPANPAGAPRALFADGAVAREPAAPSLPSESPLPEGAVTLRFVTPLRIKVRHQLTDRPRFRDLAFHMLRRTLEMAYFHVPGAAVDWDFQSLLQRSDGVQVAGADLRWLDWERWSQRQNSAMKLGGLVGRLTLEGDVAPFAPLLRAAEILHAGKGAVFGLGKLEVAAP